MILSTYVLGEKFIWQYDLLAMFFLLTGAVSIAFQANTQPVELTGDDIFDLISSMRTVAYVSLCVVFFFLDRLSLRKLL